jgi:hypothetical protein
VAELPNQHLQSVEPFEAKQEVRKWRSDHRSQYRAIHYQYLFDHSNLLSSYLQNTYHCHRRSMSDRKDN